MPGYHHPFSQRVSGGSPSGGGGPSTGIDVLQNGSLVLSGATSLDISGASVSGAGTTAAISVLPQPPDLADAVGEYIFTPTPGQTVFVLPFDVADVLDVRLNAAEGRFTFAAPRTVTVGPLFYTLDAADIVLVSYFRE